MIIEHYGIKVDIPALKFGNERDIQIRDEMYKLSSLLRQKKVPAEKKKADVLAVLKNLQHLCKFK